MLKALEEDYIFYRYVSEENYWEKYLRQAMENLTGISGENEIFDIYKNEKGKPFFSNANNPNKFSVTHSGGIWMCIISNDNVGIDLQIKRLCNYEKIAKRFFSDDEYAYVKSGEYKNFFDIWTKKESFVKYTGCGIDENFKRTNVINDKINLSTGEEVLIKSIEFLDNYSLSVCGSDKELIIKSL